jgi:tetratricopeptide (TPR) repeat protein
MRYNHPPKMAKNYILCISIKLLITSACVTHNGNEQVNNYIHNSSEKSQEDNSRNKEKNKNTTSELELFRIQDEIISTNDKINTFKRLSKFGGYAPINLLALEAFDQAKIDFSEQKYETVISNLNLYLNSLQITDTKKYLESQWMLAKAHEAQKNYVKSFKAYGRFITESLKKNLVDSSQFTEAIGNSLKVSRNIGAPHHLEKFISAIAAMDLPNEVANKIIPLIAIESANLGQHQIVHMLTSSLERKNDPKKNSTLNLTIAYIRALALLHSGNIPLSREFLEYIIKYDDKSEIRHHSLLLLGRICSNYGLWEKATEFYSQIPEESIYLKDATLESIRAHIETKNYVSARNQANKFIKFWPEEKTSYLLNVNMIYLDLNSKNFDQAESNIREIIQRLTKIKTQISDALSKGKSFTFEEIKTIHEHIKSSINNHQTLDDSLSLYNDLLNMENSLTNSHNSLRDIYYKIGSSKTNTINNQFINKTHALSYLADNLIHSGFYLAEIQENLLTKYASDLDIKKMQLNRKNISDLIKGEYNTFNTIRLNKLKVAILDLLNRSHAISQHVYDLEAKIKGASILKIFDKNVQVNLPYINSLSESIRGQKQQLQMLRDQIKKLQAKILLESGDISNFEANLLKKLLLLNESQSTIINVADRVNNAPLALRSEEIRPTWEIWRHTASNLLGTLKELREDLKFRVDHTMNAIEQIELDITNTEQEINKLYKSISVNILSNSSSISSSIILRIDENIEKHNRWLAEVHWRKLQLERGEFVKLETKYNVEREIMNSQIEFEKIVSGRKI